MRRYVTGVCAAAAVGVVLSTVGVTRGSTSGAALRAGHVGLVASPGTQLWVERYNGPGNGDDDAQSVAVSPGGGTVFVTGYSPGTSGLEAYATVAYKAATGARLWAARYSSPINDNDAYSVAASPTGKTVFVTGSTGRYYATVAYNAATGAQLWAARYTGPYNGRNQANSVAVSPSGGTVYVTGYSTVRGGLDYATVAYNAATGTQRWAARYSSPVSDNEAYSVAVSPTGKTVFVTGNSIGSTSGHYATIAYNAATGAQIWIKLYKGPGGSGYPTSLAVSPTGGTVYVTGASAEALGGNDYGTVAYNAATGAQLWAKRYNGYNGGGGRATSVAVSPSGGTVYVTGLAQSRVSIDDYATVAYNAVTGAQLWVKVYNVIGLSIATSVAVSPSGGTVYVTGVNSSAYATVAYNAATGAQLWVNRYSGPRTGGEASSMAVSPTSGTVFVTGWNDGATSSLDYTTLAYSG